MHVNALAHSKVQGREGRCISSHPGSALRGMRASPLNLRMGKPVRVSVTRGEEKEVGSKGNNGAEGELKWLERADAETGSRFWLAPLPRKRPFLAGVQLCGAGTRGAAL